MSEGAGRSLWKDAKRDFKRESCKAKKKPFSGTAGPFPRGSACRQNRQWMHWISPRRKGTASGKSSCRLHEGREVLVLKGMLFGIDAQHSLFPIPHPAHIGIEQKKGCPKL